MCLTVVIFQFCKQIFYLLHKLTLFNSCATVYRWYHNLISKTQWYTANDLYTFVMFEKKKKKFVEWVWFRVYCYAGVKIFFSSWKLIHSDWRNWYNTTKFQGELCIFCTMDVLKFNLLCYFSEIRYNCWINCLYNVI